MMTLGVSLPSSMVRAIFRSKSEASILNVSPSTSTKTGVAPSSEMTSAEEKKVKSGTNTASPAPMFHTFRARVSASVPLPHEMQCFTPTYSASPASSSFTGRPMIKALDAATSIMAASMSCFSTLYCFLKSLNCMI